MSIASTHRTFQRAFRPSLDVSDRIANATEDFVREELSADIAGQLMNDGDCPPELWREWQRLVRGYVDGRMGR